MIKVSSLKNQNKTNLRIFLFSGGEKSTKKSAAKESSETKPAAAQPKAAPKAAPAPFKNDSYQAPEYFKHDKWSYANIMVDLTNHRLPQKSNKVPS